MDHETRIGLIGVGLLGSAIAERFFQSDICVIGFDTDPARREELTALGGTACADAAQVFTQCEVILLSLPTSQVVRHTLAENAQALSANSTVVTFFPLVF